MENKIVEILIKRGQKLLDKSKSFNNFADNIEADKLLNDLSNNPHAYVLACIMDRQIKAEKAWLIPYRIKQLIGGFEFKRLNSIDELEFERMFKENNLHRFNSEMAKNFHSAIKIISGSYDGYAANIWLNNPKSATVVYRFLQFRGAGPKIATMAANILARDFKIPMSDKSCIDISPDVQVKRVFTRLGLITKEADNDQLIYKARELNPEYPGIFDYSCWEIGREFCRPTNPKCDVCYLEKQCNCGRT